MLNRTPSCALIFPQISCLIVCRCAGPLCEARGADHDAGVERSNPVDRRLERVQVVLAVSGRVRPPQQMPRPVRPALRPHASGIAQRGAYALQAAPPVWGLPVARGLQLKSQKI